MTSAPDRHPGGFRNRLRTVRPDGTPVYRHAAAPGSPPVCLGRNDLEEGLPHQPPGQPHAHDFLVLVYVERGGGTVGMGGSPTPLRDGDVHAVPPGRTIDVGRAALDHGRSWSVSFTPDAVPSLASVSPLAWAHHPLLALFAAEPTPGGASARVPEAERPSWTAWLTELADELASPERVGTREAVAALLTRLLVGAARLAPSAPAPLDPLVGRVFEQIEATYRDPVSAGDVARALGYTPGHLTTVVRERTDRTLLDWITERRMTEVRRLLRETDLPLGVVAARTGLRDATYLVRRFKARYGVTPERWRRGERARTARR
ncbi:helix-turn-helix transcriptional regulator [Promicromonospora citrea]|uniref:AraC family transcriptional regulator n=1 Tax=Promicromonospora citrea TaxID=43677 RepID=A0A8H9GKP4_9MICO|nr:AraC family transcriptional regulator [Promicromonospora citrea]NNH50848.1 helix-turn-helix transcriptional regulator [Promicromonospora citrea]GGM35499.1 AraC family transcriptional regulator [Promicromonospora citrea]